MAPTPSQNPSKSSQNNPENSGSCCAPVSPETTLPPRRGFLGSLVAWILGLVALAPSLAAGLVAFLAPMGGRQRGGLMVRLTTLDNLPPDGTPRKFPIVAEKRDAWSLSREPVGAVYLRRLPSGEVQALHVTCPHAGCPIEFRRLTGKDVVGEFYCPCHVARFDLDGKRLEEKSQSPRDMDTLSVEIRDGQEVWVEFQNFQTGTSQKIPA